jgi:preprotein translocase subunit SecG
MRRTLFFLFLAILVASILLSAMLVYLFQDVDRDQIGRLNSAFAGLCVESVLFALVIGGAVGLFAMLGKLMLRLQRSSPRARLGLWLGVGVVVCQHIGEIFVRKVLASLTDVYRGAYLIIAIIVCTAILLQDSYRQHTSRKSAEAAPTA